MSQDIVSQPPPVLLVNPHVTLTPPPLSRRIQTSSDPRPLDTNFALAHAKIALCSTLFLSLGQS